MSLPKNLTFKQREGLEPLPKLLEKDDFSQKLRAKLWGLYYTYMENTNVSMRGRYFIDEYYVSVLKGYWINILYEDISKFRNDYNYFVDYFSKLFLHGEYADILEHIEYLLRFYIRNRILNKENFQKIFDENFSPWKIVFEGKDICISSSLSESEILCIEEAYKTTVDNQKLSGAKLHIVQSVNFLKQGKWADSIRESIHAVESTVKNLLDDKDADLSKALKNMNIHQALKVACEKMYAYTNDEKGVRHSVFNEEVNCDRYDAQFMLGACSSFVSYMHNKIQNK